MTTLQVGSNFHQTRRHYTREFQHERGSVIQKGGAICNGFTEVYDQASHDLMAQTWSGAAKQNTDLPLCARCVAKAAKHGWEVAA